MEEKFVVKEKFVVGEKYLWKSEHLKNHSLVVELVEILNDEYGVVKVGDELFKTLLRKLHKLNENNSES